MAGIKGVVKEKLESVKADYAKDLAAMSHESLSSAPGGSARAPYDFTYEVVVVNERMANLVSGGTNGPWPFEGWAVAPSEFRTQEKAISEINRSVDAVLAAWDAVAEDEIEREITFPSGSTGTPIGMALMCVQHMSYHDAQLNYVQAMNGDMEVHWQ